MAATNINQIVTCLTAVLLSLTSCQRENREVNVTKCDPAKDPKCPKGTLPGGGGGGGDNNEGGSDNNGGGGGDNGGGGTPIDPNGGGGGTPIDPNGGGGGTPIDPNGGGGTKPYPDGGGGTPNDPNGGGGTKPNPDGGGGTPNDPNGGGGTKPNPDGGGGTKPGPDSPKDPNKKPDDKPSTPGTETDGPQLCVKVASDGNVTLILPPKSESKYTEMSINVTTSVTPVSCTGSKCKSKSGAQTVAKLQPKVDLEFRYGGKTCKGTVDAWPDTTKSTSASCTLDKTSVNFPSKCK